MPAEEDPSNLSIGELKKQLRWLGASLPAGGLEKSDLVAALKKARAEKADQDRQKEEKVQQQRQEKLQPGVPRESRPLDYEQKISKEKQEVVDLHVLSEEELRRRILSLGGSVPEGSVGKFYLVSVLKNVMKKEAELAELAAARAEFADQEAVAAALDRAPPPPPPPPPGSSTAQMPAPVVEPLAAATARPMAAAEDLTPFDDRPPSELSAGELRRRLRAYGAFGEEKLLGLAEKHEFVAALAEAIVEQGPPPQPQPRAAAVPEQVAKPKLVVLSEAEAATQMQELQAQFDEANMQAAAAAGAAAAEAAASIAEAEEAAKVEGV
eukprot:CAMPEP_0203924322 /NCGR_PEP_ID=MMETSP0359-20131031/64080_1 /ASSEMBLY_ACC=CAM_ASM_000338 /TAXON_ID=268821 /ORGANISM="Scrippsiella Hangoei, Strain SHTV-5" /LENGTH=323 /DNA_ID=CAMNT_0050852533 /DNA_START=89 /DNA_END=1057 /DNA_ORIENTATION=-